MKGVAGRDRGAPASEPTIVIVDDERVTRLGVRMALMRGGFRVLAEAAGREEAVEAVTRERPDVCLLEVSIPGDGIEAAREISKRFPATSVVMLSASEDTEQVLASLRAGALGYLPKDMSPDRLPAALCGVLKGEAALPRALVARVLREFRGLASEVAEQGSLVQLTRRESQILRMLGSGLTTVEVADMLSLSPVTVRRHVSAGVTKLGVTDRYAAIRALEPLTGRAWEPQASPFLTA